MGDYAKLFRSIWRDDDFRSLSASAQRTYLMLFSQPDISHCGVLPLTPGRWGGLAADTDADSVLDDIHRLAATCKIVVDEKTEELFVRTYIKWDGGYRVPNIQKALLRSAEEVASVPIRTTVKTILQTLGLTVDGTLPSSQQQQPATANTTGSQQRQPRPAANGSPNGFSRSPSMELAAAAAIEALVQHKVIVDSPRRPASYATTLRRDLPVEHRGAIDAFLTTHPDATPLVLATSVLLIPDKDAEAHLEQLGSI